MSGAPKPVCFTIAGLDPSGGAGVIADAKTFGKVGCYAAAAVTSVTFQNTTGVFGAMHQTADSVRRQIEAVVDDLDVAAIKTGMLPTREIVNAVAEIVGKRRLRNVVVDPVVRSTSGYDLSDRAALRTLIDELFPLAELVTPNIPEAELITGVAIESEEDIRDAAEIMRGMGAVNVLIKGGHPPKAEGGAAEGVSLAIDRLFLGEELHEFSSPYIQTRAAHGTGCVLSSAITANLALGKTLVEAVAAAKGLVTDAIRNAPKLGHGISPIDL